MFCKLRKCDHATSKELASGGKLFIRMPSGKKFRMYPIKEVVDSCKCDKSNIFFGCNCYTEEHTQKLIKRGIVYAKMGE